MGVERNHKKLSDTFHGILDHAKDALNTRADAKTGRHYVKGKPAHKGDSDPVAGYGDNDFDFAGDPNL
jgi:hypothetical protein